MRILMLGNSFTFTNNMPQMLAESDSERRWSTTPGAGRGCQNS